MPPSLGCALLFLTALGLPWLLARKERGRELVALTIALNLLYACGYALLVPAGGNQAHAVAGLGPLVLTLAIFVASPSFARRTLGIAKWRAALIAMTVMGTTIIPLGVIEITCRLLTDFHVLEYHRGIETVCARGA